MKAPKATTITAPIKNFSLCLAHKDCFFILLAYFYKDIYALFNLIGNTVQLGSLFHQDLYFLLPL